MSIEERLFLEDTHLKLYIHLCRWYSGRFHEAKFRGQYEDPIYGTHKLADVRRLANHVEEIDIEITQTRSYGKHMVVTIELHNSINNLNI